MSHYLRCIVLAKSLQEHYDIWFLHSDKYSSFIAREGFRPFYCETSDAELIERQVRRFDFGWLKPELLEPVFTSQCGVINLFLKHIEDHPEEYEEVYENNLIIIGDSDPTIKMAAERCNVKFISVMNAYLTRHYSGPKKMSKQHPMYTFTEGLPPLLKSFFVQKGEELAFNRIHKAHSELRSKFGLKKYSSYREELEGDETLLCDLPVLFPQKSTLPSNFKWVGPLIYTDDYIKEKTLLEELDPTKKTLFVTMGSTGDWRCVAFLNDPSFSCYNIVTAGDDDVALYADHIIKREFVNTSAVFPSVDLVISHGGNGTIYHALKFGIPVLAASSNIEQEWNIAALERTGTGAMLIQNDIVNTGKQIELWLKKKGMVNLQKFSEWICQSIEEQPLRIENLFLKGKEKVRF